MPTVSFHSNTIPAWMDLSATTGSSKALLRRMQLIRTTPRSEEGSENLLLQSNKQRYFCHCCACTVAHATALPKHMSVSYEDFGIPDDCFPEALSSACTEIQRKKQGTKHFYRILSELERLSFSAFADKHWSS